MKTPKRQATVTGAAIADTVRASISFPQELYETLKALAKHKKVSLAWIVRDAAEMYRRPALALNHFAQRLELGIASSADLLGRG